MLRSACAISNDRPNGTSTFSGSSDFMMACGMASRLLLAKEIPGSPCSPRTRSRKRPGTAKFECFIWRFARTGKISSGRSANSKSAESNSNSKITKSHTRFISAIPTATSWRLRRTTSSNAAHPALFVMSSEVACQAVASCEGWRHPAKLPQSYATGFLDFARNDRLRQFFCFFRCERDTVHCDRLLALNAESEGSIDGSEICELSGSGVPKIWEG